MSDYTSVVNKIKEAAKDMPQGRPTIVIPTIRDTTVFKTFYNEWIQLFAGCNVIIVEDRKERMVFTGIHTSTDFYPTKPDNVWIFTWEDIDEIMGEYAWIIPRQSDCVRSFGYLVAQASKPLFILTLDDDVFPIGNPITEHYKVLTTSIDQHTSAFNTLIDKRPRGLLIGFGTVPQVSHGAWYNVPDYDADTHARNYGETVGEKDFYKGIIPRGAYAPMCGMNLAWDTSATPYMYFTLQGRDLNGESYNIDRCGDIWAGYFAQANNIPMATGYAPVNHNKLSNVWVNMCKEENASSYTECFHTLVSSEDEEEYRQLWMNEEQIEYFIKLFSAYKIWIKIVCGIGAFDDYSLGATKDKVKRIIQRLNGIK